MDDIKLDCAKAYRDRMLLETNFAQRRCSELADEFTRLEVQVAAILIAFAGIFLSYFDAGKGTSGWSTTVVFLVKSVYGSSVFFLISSLAFGLIHLKRKEKFWDENLNAKFVAYKKWLSATQGEVTFDVAKSYQEGTALEKGNITFSPVWTWALQTICLGVALLLFFILFLVFLFT